MFWGIFHSIKNDALQCLTVTYFPNSCFQKVPILKRDAWVFPGQWDYIGDQIPHPHQQGIITRALHCCCWVTLTWQTSIIVALSEGFPLLLSVESLVHCHPMIFGWLESNSKTLQDIINTDAWTKGSHCALKVFSDVRKESWGGGEMLFFIIVGETWQFWTLWIVSLFGGGWVGMGCTFYK